MPFRRHRESRNRAPTESDRVTPPPSYSGDPQRHVSHDPPNTSNLPRQRRTSRQQEPVHDPRTFASSDMPPSSFPQVTSDFAALLSSASLSGTSREGSILRTRLVVGIDFGTTYSGVAYAIVHPNTNPESVDIHTVRNWERRLHGGNRALSNKVPSLIAFDEQDNNKPYWGFNIPQRLKQSTIRHVKLLLEPDVARRVSSMNNVINPEATRILLETQQRSAVEVASIYIKCLWNHAKQQIIQHMSLAAFNFAEKVILFTVPAVWSERAKHNTYLIAANAGLASQDFQLNMVSEPEAAAIGILQDRVRAAQLVNNDIYVVLDAGGGTVDLTSYQVTSTRPLKLIEAAVGDGYVCGAAFLEVNFRKLLKTLFGEDSIHQLNPVNEDRIIQDWENSIRGLFTGGIDYDYVLVTPGIPNEVSERIENGMIQFTAAEIKSVFTPVVDKVKQLVHRQISALNAQGLRPKAIFMVGGLGCNWYLASQLKELCQTFAEPDIQVEQPDLAWDSVAYGAIKCDILGFGNIVSMKLARYNIGTTCSDHWDPDRYLPEQKTQSRYDGAWRAKDAIEWLVRRHDELQPNKIIKTKRTGRCWEDKLDRLMLLPPHMRKVNFKFDIIASSEDNAPEYPTPNTRIFARIQHFWDLTQFPKETALLEYSPNGRPYRRTTFEMQIIQSMAGMRFNIYFGSKLIGEVADVEFVAIPETVASGSTVAFPPSHTNSFT